MNNEGKPAVKNIGQVVDKDGRFKEEFNCAFQVFVLDFRDGESFGDGVSEFLGIGTFEFEDSDVIINGDTIRSEMPFLFLFIGDVFDFFSISTSE